MSGQARRTGSIYASLYVKGSHRAKRTPRVARPWRPKVIAWAGPNAFVRNRFYELNQWYKARIAKPPVYPKLFIIDPDDYLLTLDERLKKEEIPRYNIGYMENTPKVTPLKLNLPEEVLDKMSRKKQLKIDIRVVQHYQLSIFYHYRIFDDLFHAPVYIYNTQGMRLRWGNVGIYQGNLIDAVDAENEPDVLIENLGNGYTSLLLVNIDGNPYEKPGEVVHWFVCNVPDGGNVKDGTEIVPYLQPLPFKGTGYHRLVVLLLRHKDVIDASTYKPNSPQLVDRIMDVSVICKNYENICTPSAIAFAQVTWDISVNRALHAIGMKAPLYRYEYNLPLKIEQKEFPLKPHPFDLYLDQYRDPKDVQADLIKKRIRMRTVSENPKQPKYPDIDYVENKKRLPFWMHDKLIKENCGEGQYHAIWNNSLD